MNHSTVNILGKNNNKSNFLSVEGNIGSGKSTFLKKIEENFNIQSLLEPCHIWQNIDGENLLEKFYKDTKRWAYAFQLYAFLTRIETIEKRLDSAPHSFFIAERSILADRYAFSQLCYNEKNMSSLEWKMYRKWFDWTIERLSEKTIPLGIIYLYTEPETSMKRIKARGRQEEANISQYYIESLHNHHNDWLIKKKNIHKKIKNIPILILDCNQDFEKDSKAWRKMIDSISNFINENFSYNITPKKEINYGISNNKYINK